MVGRVRIAPADGDAERALILSGKVDPDREVMLPAGAPDEPRSGASRPGTAHILADEPSRVGVETTGPQNGWLVLADAWAPGWRAEIDGKRTIVYRANYAFRAVHVRAGRHRVEFRYDPMSFKAGLLLTGLALGLAAALASGTGKEGHI
jgi:hypothetical protein